MTEENTESLQSGSFLIEQLWSESRPKHQEPRPVSENEEERTAILFPVFPWVTTSIQTFQIVCHVFIVTSY